MLSLNQIIAQLQTIQRNQGQINDFYFGDPFEITTAKYPLLGVSLLPGTVSKGINTTRLLLFVADLVDEDESFENEVLSDTQLMALDVYAKFWGYLEDNSIELSRDAAFSSFTERFDDRVSGWQIEIDVRQFYSKNECQVPEKIIPQVEERYITTDLEDGQIFLEDLEESELFFVVGYGITGPVTITGSVVLQVWNGSTWGTSVEFEIDDPTFKTESIYKVRLNGATAGETNTLTISADGVEYEKEFILT